MGEINTNSVFYPSFSSSLKRKVKYRKAILVCEEGKKERLIS
jgi:hypothetical protein